jgi:NADH dehydrogenase (ubiquinone) 1 alpha subcomplex subunit 6
MSGTRAVRAVRQVKPMLSVDQTDARLRVLSLYKAWHRHIPYMCKDFVLPKSVEQCRAQLRVQFLKNKHVKDIRVIDALVVKGQQDLKEVVEHWAQPTHMMSKWFKEEHIEEKPQDFLSKFLSGQ